MVVRFTKIGLNLLLVPPLFLGFTAISKFLVMELDQSILNYAAREFTVGSRNVLGVQLKYH